jgi:hypothetical protein
MEPIVAGSGFFIISIPFFVERVKILQFKILTLENMQTTFFVRLGKTFQKISKCFYYQQILVTKLLKCDCFSYPHGFHFF